MPLIILEPATLKSKPSATVAGTHFVFPETPVELLEQKKVDGVDWVKLRATLDGAVVEGWLPAAKTKAVDTLPDKPTDLWLFIKSCTLAGRGADGVNRDYLIALAIVESNLENFGPRVEGSTAFGPFQLTDLEWLRYLDNGGRNEGFREADRLDLYLQAYGAAYLTNTAREALGSALGADDPSSASGPYVANSMDLFLARMLGVDSAVQAIRAANDTQGNAGEAKLSTLSPSPDAIANYERFLKPSGVTSPTILQVYGSVEKAFDEAMRTAFKLVGEHTPEDLPKPISTGTPPWMLKAREEANKTPPIAEKGTPPNPEILKYFEATDLKTNKELAWCGAFVAWCLRNSGDSTVANSVVEGAALAANWRGWGEGISPKEPKIPEGALVLLSPEPDTDSSGHVAFLVKKEGSKVRLLGGNQSNRLKESSYAASRIVWIGWRNWTEAAGRTPTGANGTSVAGTVGPLDDNDWEKYIETLGKKESDNNYTEVNQFGFAGRWQFGALALIDHGYLRPNTKQSAMANDSSWTGKDGIRNRKDWLSNKPVQDKVMLEYTRAHYRQMIKMKVLKDGAAKDHVAGLLAAAHLLGVGGARDLVNGKVSSDANGTTSKSYYNLLSKAFGGDGVLDT